jgi:hypothetical protein
VSILQDLSHIWFAIPENTRSCIVLMAMLWALAAAIVMTAILTLHPNR